MYNVKTRQSHDTGGGDALPGPIAPELRAELRVCYIARMDAETLRRIAELNRSRANSQRSYDHRKTLERLGAQRALEMLARDSAAPPANVAEVTDSPAFLPIRRGREEA